MKIQIFLKSSRPSQMCFRWFMITLLTFKLNLNQLGIFTCTFILMVCDHIGHIYTFIFFIYVDSVYASLDLIFELICVCTVHI